MNESCIFCRIINREIPSKFILETDLLVAISDIAPKAPVHLLIVPKKHIIDLRDFTHQDSALAEAMFTAAQQLSRIYDDIPFRLVMNNGHEAGQRVMHLHMHFLAGAHMVD